MMTIQNMAIQHYMIGTTRNVLLGGSLCYAINNQKYLDIPLIILFPSVYTGYHLYKNKEQVAKFIKVCITKTDK